MKSKPLRVRFGTASFSAELLDVELIKTDASQPWMIYETADKRYKKTVILIRLNSNSNRPKQRMGFVEWEKDTDPHKAVMELHSQKRCSQRGSIWDVLLHIIQYNGFHFWTGLVVKSHFQITLNRDQQTKKTKNEETKMTHLSHFSYNGDKSVSQYTPKLCTLINKDTKWKQLYSCSQETLCSRFSRMCLMPSVSAGGLGPIVLSSIVLARSVE